MLARETTTAGTVVVGGGIIGAAVALNLLREGARDVLLLDEHATGEGTSWHTPGFMGTVRITRTGDLVAQDSVALWEDVTARRGPSGWYRTGGLRIARTEVRAAELAAMAAMALELGIPCEVGGPALVEAAHPGFRSDDVRLAVHAPDEGWVDGYVMTRALVAEAVALGLRVGTGTRVTGFLTAGERVTGVRTWRGTVSCDQVVLAAGCHSMELAATVGVRIPAHTFLARATVLTAPEGLPREFPAVRDNDGMSYFRSDPAGVVVGGDLVAPEPIDDPAPLSTPRLNVATDPASMRGQIVAAAARYPALADSSVVAVVRGPECFSADGEPVIGASGVDGLVLATAGSGHGVAFAGGMGKAVAQLVLGGRSDIDVTEYALSRFDGRDLAAPDVAAAAEHEYVNYLGVRPWLVAADAAGG